MDRVNRIDRKKKRKGKMAICLELRSPLPPTL
jgi:hypothetical protein